MKKTQRLLMTIFSLTLLVAMLLYICGEFLQMDMTLWPNASRSQQFICSTVMILLTISLLPLSLRLFKFSRINADLLERKATALARWGSVRLLVMGLLLVVNTFLYYAFGYESTYGYLAVVTLLCMPFVVPTMSRCEAEVAKVEVNMAADEKDAADEEVIETDEEVNSSHRKL